LKLNTCHQSMDMSSWNNFGLMSSSNNCHLHLQSNCSMSSGKLDKYCLCCYKGQFCMNSCFPSVNGFDLDRIGCKFQQM
jgi:hypothetical protein